MGDPIDDAGRDDPGYGDIVYKKFQEQLDMTDTQSNVVGGPFEGAIIRRLMAFYGAEGGRISREKYLAVFDRLDRDRDGSITEAELRAALWTIP
jgi:hypothetical protein